MFFTDVFTGTGPTEEEAPCVMIASDGKTVNAIIDHNHQMAISKEKGEVDLLTKVGESTFFA